MGRPRKYKPEDAITICRKQRVDWYYEKMADPDYKEKEKKRLREKYHIKKEFKAFLAILLD